jgi:hypothetical protein
MGRSLIWRTAMAEYHTVEQGEYLAAIAKNYGFASYTTIWNHDNNADLRELRKNPNVLLPGDKVFIPDKGSKHAEIQTGQLTRFTVRQDKMLLRLVLDELFGVPLANAKCKVNIDGKPQDLTTDDNATVEFEVSPSAQSIELIVKEEGSQQLGVAIPLKLGHLDPVDEQTGQIARLNNLGYFAGPLDPVDDKLLLSAIEEFQCDQGLQVDGKCGPKTQAKLLEVHGC